MCINTRENDIQFGSLEFQKSGDIDYDYVYFVDNIKADIYTELLRGYHSALQRAFVKGHFVTWVMTQTNKNACIVLYYCILDHFKGIKAMEAIFFVAPVKYQACPLLYDENPEMTFIK